MQNSSSNTSLQRKPLSRQSFSSNGDNPPSARSLLAEDDSGQASLPGRPVEQDTNEITIEQQSNTYFNYKPVSTEENAASEVKGPRRRVGVASLPTDCAAVLLSMAMIVFVSLVWKLDGSRVINNSYDSWKNAITILATVFPILFASIVGRLMTEATRWNLEKGSTIGCLEQLMGSQTVGGSVLTILRLRSLSVLSPLLLIIWSFSPLGAQSLLRMTELQDSYREIQTTATFFDTTAKSQIADWYRRAIPSASSTSAVAKLAVLKALYTTLVTAPEKIKNDTMDIWGNVKIPILKDVEVQGWQNTSPRSATLQYASLMGVPVHSIAEGNTSFSLESTYVQLECINATYYDVHNGISTAPRLVVAATKGLENASGLANRPWKETYSLPNGTWHGYGGGNWRLVLDRFVGALWLKNNGTEPSFYRELFTDPSDKMDRPIIFLEEIGVEAGPTLLRFDTSCVSKYDQVDGEFRSFCGVKQRYVESIVRCSSLASKKECIVVKQRLSQKPHPPANISQLSFPGVFWTLLMGLSSTGSITYQSEPSLYYIKDPSLKSQGSQNLDFLRNVTREDVSIRLTQLINTFLQLGQLHLNGTTASEPDAKFVPNVTVSATNKEEFLIVHVSRGWAVLSLVSSLVLLVASIVGAVFKHMARGPEALGYVSTALRDSRYVELDSESGRMNGIELSRKMRNERIRLGVVAVGNDKLPVLGIGREKDTCKL